MLDYLFAHQLQPRFRYTNMWAENDLLIWDHLGTLHRTIADYGPDEIRLIRRCQVMATKVFDPEFLRPTRELAGREWRNRARGSATTRRLSPQSSRRHPAAAALFEK